MASPCPSATRAESPARATEAAALASISRETSSPNSRAAGIGPRQFDEIASGAAADLEHAVAGPGVETGDRLIATQEIEFAAQVVDVALAAIHPVHELAASLMRQGPSSV